MDALLNFIALGTISEIDNYYAYAIRNFPLKKAVEDPPQIKNRSKNIKFSSRSKIGKLIRVLYRFYRICYASAYFYFTPYVIPVITYLFVGLK